MFFKNWNTFEKSLFFLSFAIAFLLTVKGDNSILSFIVFLTGILCVVFAAKGVIFTYHAGIINAILYSYIAYKNGLFGEVYLNLLFYFPINIVGIFIWRKRLKQNIVIMQSLALTKTIGVIIISLLAIFLMGFFLSKNPAQNMPYIDASTNVLGIIATILMILRFKEQWLLYICLNILTITMWVIRTASNGFDGQMMIVMWSVFLINSVYGYYNWSKGAKMASTTRVTNDSAIANVTGVAQ